MNQAIAQYYSWHSPLAVSKSVFNSFSSYQKKKKLSFHFLLSQEQLTMNEPRNSKARRQQYAIKCSVMASVLVYTAMTSGVLLEINPTEGVFPGGNFCYKFTTRDYAASYGMGRIITMDWAALVKKVRMY
jgi:hypothetical protein